MVTRSSFYRCKMTTVWGWSFASMYVWSLEYVHFSFHVSCSLILCPSTEVTDRSSFCLPPAVMLPLPTYFLVFPSSCVISPFTWMLAVTAIACDKRCELVDIGQGWLEVNITECRVGSLKLCHHYHPWNFFPWPQNEELMWTVDCIVVWPVLNANLVGCFRGKTCRLNDNDNYFPGWRVQ